jgi:hypothetical protein
MRATQVGTVDVYAELDEAAAEVSPTRFDIAHETRAPWYVAALIVVGVMAAFALVLIAVVSFSNPAAGP